MACILIDTYHSPASLFISSGVLLSEEGTTQEDPPAILMYAFTIILLIYCLPDSVMFVPVILLHQCMVGPCSFAM